MIEHERVASAEPGRDIATAARVSSAEPLRDVSLYYRAMDQTRPWKRGRWTQWVTSSTFWPDWREETPHLVVAVGDGGE